MRETHKDAQELPSAPAVQRRDCLRWGCYGLGVIALSRLLHAESSREAPRSTQGGTPPRLAPRARRAINIFLVGGLSQVDSFDHKPALALRHGEPPPLAEQPSVFFGQVGRLRRPDWGFTRRGRSGLWVSDLFPHLGEMADELTVINSMVSETGNHTPALFLSNSGFQFNGFPSLGSWLSYGLGNDSDSLPTYVVLPDARGAPSGGASSWSSGFLPAQHQGVRFGPGERPVRDL